MVYDITDQDTFAKAKHWVSELQKNADGSIGEDPLQYTLTDIIITKSTQC